MRVITKRRLREFWSAYPQAQQPLLKWFDTARKTDWKNFSDVRTSFRHADIYRDCVIFDIGGNKFRLIVKIRYQKKWVYVRFVLTHEQYDKNDWMEDCEC